MSDSEAKITLSADDKASPVVKQAAENFKNLQGTLVDINEYVGQSSRSFADVAAASQGTIGSIASLTAELKQLTAEFNVLDPETEAFARHAQDIQAVSGRLAELKGAAAGAGEATSQFNLQNVALIATGVSVAGVLQQIAGGVRATAQEALTSADAMNALHNRAEVLFGSDYPQMVQQSEQLGSSLGRSATEILGFETKITALGTGFGLTKQAAEGMSSQMSQLAVDIGLVYQESDDQALQRLESALMGNQRALRDLDIPMKNNILDQYLMQQGSKLTMSQLDAESQAQVRLHYLLEKGHDIHLIAQKDTGNLDDKMKRLGATWDDLLRTMGQPILPAVIASFQALNDLIKGTESAAEKATSAIANLLGPVAAGAFGGLEAGGGGGSSNVIDLNDSGLDLSLGKTSDAMEKGTAAADDWAKHLGLSGSAAGSAGKAAEKLKADLESLNTKYEDTSRNIQNKLDDLDNAHQNKMQSMAQKMQTLGDAAATLKTTYRDQLQGVEDKLTELKSAFGDTMDGITNKLEDAVSKQQEKIDKLTRKLDDASHKAGAVNQDKIDLVLNNRQRDSSGNTYTGDISEAEKQAYNLTDQHAQQINDYQDLLKAKKELADFDKQNKLTPDQRSAATKEVGESDFVKSTEKIGLETKKAEEKYEKDRKAEMEKEVKDRAAYLERMGKNQAEQQALRDKMTLEQTVYGLERTQLIETQTALLGFRDNMTTAMTDMAKVTKKNVDDMVADLRRLATAYNAATLQMQGKSMVADGGGKGVTRTIQLQQQGSQ